MIIEKLKDENNLTESEKQIAHYLLNDANHIDHMTSTELAKAAFTSQSTVVRLYQKLNFKSFREFMTILAIERKDYLQSEKIYEGNPFEKMTSYDNTKNIVNEIFENTLTITNMALERNTITRICNRILNSQAIEIYAIGDGQATATYFQRELLTIGKQCIVLGNIDDEYFNKIKDSKSHLAIILNMTNNENHFIKIAQKLNDLQIYTFCITQKDDEKLLKLCQDNLQVDNPSDNIKLEKTILFLSYQYIVYFIISLVQSKINNVLLKY